MVVRVKEYVTLLRDRSEHRNRPTSNITGITNEFKVAGSYHRVTIVYHTDYGVRSVILRLLLEFPTQPLSLTCIVNYLITFKPVKDFSTSLTVSSANNPQTAVDSTKEVPSCD